MNEHVQIVCPHCNAKQLGPSENCWLCRKPLDETPSPFSAPAEVLPTEPENLSFSLATLFLIITLASVCMGLLVAAPGLGVFACIIMVPVLIRTMRVVRHRERMGESVGPLQKVLMFSSSFALSSVLVIVVCVSAFCSFCGVCITLVSLGAEHNRGDMLAWGVGMCFAAVVGIVIVIQLIRWIRRRYRRDMGRE